MRVYIDDVRLPLKHKSYKNLGEVLSEVRENIEDRGKILMNVIIDGKELDDKLFVRMKNIKTIEIVTESKTHLFSEMIKKTADKIQELIIAYEAVDGKTNPMPRDMAYAFGTLIELNWLGTVLEEMKYEANILYTYEDFDEYLAEYQGVLNSLQAYYMDEDLLGFGLRLGIFGLPLLRAFVENSEDYIAEVTNEEKRKRLLI